MQPIDALTVKAVIEEASPILLNRRVDKVQQLGPDELLITFRTKSGMGHLLVCAHAVFGRLCLIGTPAKVESSGPAHFGQVTSKHLKRATLVAMTQVPGERIVDLIFSCPDDFGTPAVRVLTAEIMGRHSNLIFWDKESKVILGCSHPVTLEMSRKRQLLTGYQYSRPPAQEKVNIFKVTRGQLQTTLDTLPKVLSCQSEPLASQQWLLNTFAGLGRSLADELVQSSGFPLILTLPLSTDTLADSLWQRISDLQTIRQFKAGLRLDLSGYSITSWSQMHAPADWKTFPSVNDLVEEYYRSLEAKERFQKLKDQLMSELKSQHKKLHSRIDAASGDLGNPHEISDYKKFGDLVLIHLAEIQSGQCQLVCEDPYSPGSERVVIPLKPNLSPSQNAQNMYRLYAKTRARQRAAQGAFDDASGKLEIVNDWQKALDQAQSLDELGALRDEVLGSSKQALRQGGRQPSEPRKKSKLLSVISSDGWTILVGRNRQENDELVSRVAQAHDIWMHIMGQSGAHVLIRVPSTGQTPSSTTLEEAGQLAARFSKGVTGGRARVVYTQCRYLRKLNRPGSVTYENESTLEVDTSKPMPSCFSQLFARPPAHQLR